MIREKTNISLSDKDEHRLTIYDVPAEETKRLTKGATSAFLTITLIAVVVLGVLIALLFFWMDNLLLRGLMILFIVIDAFLLIVNTNMYYKNRVDFRSRSHYIEVTLLDKLPIENLSIKEAGYRKEMLEFYPVKAKDTKKNYITTIYLKKEEYDNFEAGKLIRIYVSLRKDRKKKK